MHLGLILVIIFICVLIIESTADYGARIILEVPEDEQRLYELTYRDGSKLIIYSAKKKATLDAIEREMNKSVIMQSEDDKVSTAMANVESYDKLISDGPPYVSRVPIRYSTLHGAITHASDVRRWANTTMQEMKESNLAVLKALFGAYVHVKYLPMMVIFKYAANEGRSAAVAIKPFMGSSLAEETKVTDYLNMLKVKTNERVHIRQLL